MTPAPASIPLSPHVIAVLAHHHLVVQNAAIFAGHDSRSGQHSKRDQRCLRRIRSAGGDDFPFEISQRGDVRALANDYLGRDVPVAIAHRESLAALLGQQLALYPSKR
jgi:hypothetical protein